MLLVKWVVCLRYCLRFAVVEEILKLFFFYLKETSCSLSKPVSSYVIFLCYFCVFNLLKNSAKFIQCLSFHYVILDKSIMYQKCLVQVISYAYISCSDGLTKVEKTYEGDRYISNRWNDFSKNLLLIWDTTIRCSQMFPALLFTGIFSRN